MADARFASNLTNQPGAAADADTSLASLIIAGVVLLILGLVLVWLFFLLLANG